MIAQFEKVTSGLNSSFKAFVYEHDNFEAPLHFHNEYELTYIVKGKGMRYVGNSIQKFEEGDFVLLGPDIPHCWKNTPKNKGIVKSLVFQWDAAILGDGWIDQSEFITIKKFFDTASKGLKFDTQFANKTLPRLNRLMKESPFKKLMDFITLLEELSNTEEVELLTTTEFTARLDTKNHDRIDMVYDYVQENYNNKIRLQDVSGLVSMGDEAFCRFFKKSLNKSFFTFVNEYRINLACKMLIETNNQINQVAYDCGYESLPFFYRQFQKFIKCSPLVFRKMYLKANS